MTNLLCFILGHHWMRVTDWLPVVARFVPGHSWEDSIIIYALGMCSRCRIQRARRVRGTHTWGYGTGKGEVGPEQAVAIWRKELAGSGIVPVDVDTIFGGN